MTAVDITGNRFVQKETLLYYVSTKPGDRLDEKRLRDDFRRLWDTGFVDDLYIDVRDTPARTISASSQFSQPMPSSCAMVNWIASTRAK